MKRQKSSPGVTKIPPPAPSVPLFSIIHRHHLQWNQERDVIFVHVLKTEKSGSCAFFVSDQWAQNTTVKK